MENYKIAHPECVLTFVALGEKGSFIGAAAALRVSRSVVSDRIKRLEAYVGTQLVVRTTRRMVLTPAGDQYFHECKRLFLNYRQVLEQVRNDYDTPRGLLRISAPDYLVSNFLIENVVSFTDRYPEVSINLVTTDGPLDLVTERVDIDLRVGQPKDSSLHAIKLTDFKPYLVASTAYLARAGLPKSPQDLAMHRLIVHDDNQATRFWELSTADQQTERVPVHGQIQVNSLRIVRKLVLAHGGIAILPSFLVNTDLRAGRLQQVLTGWAPPVSGIYAIYLSRKYLPARVRFFIDMLRKQFA